ncbi:MAG TPA: type II toxin-antitoxin system VapC family toxin [Candidatus Didemnitutus sp.]|jgi:predicted nucleic acid-binding protein
MSELRRYYWDSSVFCSFFNKEQGRTDTVSDLLKDAHSGKSEIITSSFTLVEVLKLKDGKPITVKQEQQLEDFFQYPFIKIVNAERGICERARQFVWKHGMKPKDAVHMATAEFANKIVTINELFSWDGDFTKLNGKIAGITFALSAPYMQQTLLKLEGAEDEKAP